MEEREIGHKNKMAVIRLKCRKEMGVSFFMFLSSFPELMQIDAVLPQVASN